MERGGAGQGQAAAPCGEEGEGRHQDLQREVGVERRHQSLLRKWAARYLLKRLVLIGKGLSGKTEKVTELTLVEQDFTRGT